MSSDDRIKTAYGLFDPLLQRVGDHVKQLSQVFGIHDSSGESDRLQAEGEYPPAVIKRQTNR